MTEKEQEIQNEEEKPQDDYNSDNIKILEDLEGVRKRPSMYIGSTGKRGFHHLAIECIDNSIDEALAGHCSYIEVILHSDNSISIIDNGRGIPIDIHKRKGISTLELVFSSLHSGGKFDKKSYAISGGLHGVGLAVVNACSEWAIVNVWRNDKCYEMKCGRGKIIEHIKEVPLTRADKENKLNRKTGTGIRFYPDHEIFNSIPEEDFVFDTEVIENHLRDLAFLNPIKIILRNEKKCGYFPSYEEYDENDEEYFSIYDEDFTMAELDELADHLTADLIDSEKKTKLSLKTETDDDIGENSEKDCVEINENIFFSEYLKIFQFKEGLIDFVKFLNLNKRPLCDPINFQAQEDNIVIDIALQYTETYQTLIRTYVNNIHTIEGGTHLTGFKSAITRAFNLYVKDNPSVIKNMSKKDKAGISLSGADVREGVTVVLSVKVPEPQFEGQTKTKLGNPEIRTIVHETVYTKILEYLDSNPVTGQAVINKCLRAQRARIASQKARDLTRRKGVLDNLRLPGKLADCSSKDATECELFIVEGDSAGGSAKQGRDRRTQAILPLRGKILNVEKARFSKVIGNKEIRSMIRALGVEIIEDTDDESENVLNFDYTHLRYHKVIIMCDADVDGHHIETLLLTFFLRHMKELVEMGKLYLAVPPIYKLSYRKHSKYLFIADESSLLDAEINIFMEEHKIPQKKLIKVARYKGLGEMNPDELRETTMNHANRLLHRVKINNDIEVDATFSLLMGKEVLPRKKYIMSHYAEALNLDI